MSAAPKFTTGDRVRVTGEWCSVPQGTVFVVATVRAADRHSPDGLKETSWFYGGDVSGFGVWETFLEAVEPDAAPDPRKPAIWAHRAAQNILHSLDDNRTLSNDAVRELVAVGIEFGYKCGFAEGAKK